ncbi:MAG: hypothetical protein JSU65_01535 [Candidatus Zixiibacteriota bacterium]|nr:MAG: hypothetical protein JSU65_01535 [candidate division Zixibacteria bacterium]
MSIQNELSTKLGQLFIVGFPGKAPANAFLQFIREEQIGGLILFEENCPTHEQVRENVERIRDCFNVIPPFIAVDQEGGRICRLRGAPAEFRAPMSFADSGDVDLFKEIYSRSAVYMEALGISLNLAPVADIWLNNENHCLKDRCFGDSPEMVAEFVRAAVEVSHASGLICCLKHFPGLGAATIDPHEGVSEVDYDRIIWEQREKLPFEAGIQQGADLLMTTHLKAPGFDDTIVTGSHKIISGLARKDLQFDGPIVTDDLCMEGASVLGSFGERAVAAFNAGHDLLLFGKDTDAAMEAYDYFADACGRGEVSLDRLRAALDRVAGLRYRLGRSVVR